MRYPEHSLFASLFVCALLVLGALVAPRAPLRAESRYELPSDTVPPESIQFPRQPVLPAARFVTAGELAVWARNRNLVLVDDCGLGDLRDGVAELIPSTGLRFTLSAPGKSRAFLYLDLVSFRPLPGFRPHLTPMCDTTRDQVTIPDSGNVQLRQPLWLEVIVNGRVVRTLYQGGGTYLQSPVRIAVDRELLRKRRLNVELRPSPGEAFFAIWDVVVSDSAEMPPDGTGDQEEDMLP